VYRNTGVFVKVAPNHADKSASGYFFAFNKFPHPPPAKPGQAVVWRLFNINFEGGAENGVPVCAKNIPINVGGYNTVRVISSHDSFTYRLNGHFVCQFRTNLGIPIGAVMVATFISTPNAGNSLEIDRITIKSLKPGGPR
jgi:hypothetical protein